MKSERKKKGGEGAGGRREGREATKEKVMVENSKDLY